MAVSGVNNSYRDWLKDSGKNDSMTGPTGVKYDAVFSDKKKEDVSVDDFLNLMVAQLKNQDFMNPVDDTQYVTQLAQFATMQQMQDMAAYSKSNYAMSLLGRDITCAKYTMGGGLEKVTGVVTKITLVDNEYKIFIGDKSFSLEQVMELNFTPPKPVVPPAEDEGKDDEDEDEDKTEKNVNIITPNPPVDPNLPTDPVVPEKPVDPVEPEKPIDPVEPEKPVDPVEPEKPTEPDPEKPGGETPPASEV